MGAGMLHTHNHPRGAGAWAILTGGILVAAMQHVTVAGPVRWVDRHGVGARLLQVEDPRRVRWIADRQVKRWSCCHDHSFKNTLHFHRRTTSESLILLPQFRI